MRDDKTFISGEGVGTESDLQQAVSRHDAQQRRRRTRSAAQAGCAPAAATRHADDERGRDPTGRAAGRGGRATSAHRRCQGSGDRVAAFGGARLVGWPDDGRKDLLHWGPATFDALGPINRYSARAVPTSLRMLRFAKNVVRRRAVIEGSMGHDILVAADAGKLAHRECSALMIDYLVPSLDTTISGIANALALFAIHPDQWELLCSQPSLLTNAINEVLRYESPLRAFTRKVRRRTTRLRTPTSRLGRGCSSSTPRLIETSESGRIRTFRHHPRRHPSSRFRARHPRVRRSGTGSHRDAGDARGTAGAGGPDRAHGTALMGTQQHHPVL